MDYPRTDMGNALMFVSMFREKVRFDTTTGKWIAWDGKRWSRGNGEIQAQMYCRGIAHTWYQKLADCGNKEESNAVFRHWQYTSSAVGVKNMLFLAKSEPGIAVSGEELDKHPFLLNVLDGTIDLKTGIIRSHDPNDLMTQLAPVSFDKSLEHPSMELWLRCLEDWHPGDVEMQVYLQKLAGYCLTGDISSRCFPIFWGTGKNGKNVFADTIMLMLGDYAGVAPRSLVEASGREEHPTEVADLWKKRLVIVSEPKRGSKLKVSLVKAMTGDSRLKARFMRMDFFDFNATHKAIMLTQNLPIVDETRDAIWDRLHKVKWGVRIATEKQDPRLIEKLRGEWTGILRWALAGCLEWQKGQGDLKPTKGIEMETRAYRDEQNPAKKFIETHFIVGRAEMFTPSAQVNKLLAEWIEFAEGDRILTKADVDIFLREYGCINSPRRVGGELMRGWIGLGLRYKG